VTAFGFGNAVLREGGEHPEAEAADEADPFGAEPTWLLREGAVSRPFNLDTLVIWTLLFGLVNQETAPGGEDQAELISLTRMLRDDLLGEDRWFVTLKGRSAG